MDIFFHELCSRLDDQSMRHDACRQLFNAIELSLVEEYIRTCILKEAITIKVYEIASEPYFKEYFFTDESGLEYMLKINCKLDSFAFMSNEQKRDYYWFINRFPKFVPFRVPISFDEFLKNKYCTE